MYKQSRAPISPLRFAVIPVFLPMQKLMMQLSLCLCLCMRVFVIINIVMIKKAGKEGGIKMDSDINIYLSFNNFERIISCT